MNLLRSASAHGHHKVTFVELFFDLVFVFAITQLSHGLIGHFGAMALLHTAVLLLAVWWVWVYTAWVTNWLDPEREPVRLLLLALMAAGLMLSASIPAAFESRGVVFAGAYVTMQLGRTLFMIWAVRQHPGMRRNFQRIFAWLAAGAVCWLAGAAVEGHGRLAWWALAVVIEYVSPSVYFWVPGLGRSGPTDWEIEGGHMAERCALFIIIALGESILVTGATLAELAWDAPTLAAFGVSFVGALAMWWLYFDATVEAGTESITRAADPGRIARAAYTYVHVFLVAGIVMAAVADEFVLAHPLGHTEPKAAITVLGSAALYLGGSLGFKRAILGAWRVSHGIALLALGVLALGATSVSPLVLSAWATGVLVALAAWERRVRRVCPQPSLAEH